MRARRSSIPLPKPRRGRPGPPPAAPPHLDPTSRSRRRAAVFGCGARASSVRRCDGVARGPAGVRGPSRRSKRLGRLSRPRPAGLESWRPGRAALRCEGVRGELPQSSDFFSARWGSQRRRDGASTSRFCLNPNCFLFSRASARDRLVLAACQITAPREAAREFKGHRGQRPVLGGARGRRGAPDAPTPRRRLARHQNLGPPS